MTSHGQGTLHGQGNARSSGFLSDYLERLNQFRDRTFEVT